MAARYWVGGTATWNATVGTKWALTSGGAGGQAVPTATDDVFFDAASGASVVSVASAVTIGSLTCTGFTGSIASNPVGSYTMTVKGGAGTNNNFILGAPPSTYAMQSFTLSNTVGNTFNVGMNGNSLSNMFYKGGNVCHVSLVGDFTLTGTAALNWNTGILTTNNYPMTMASCDATSDTVARGWNVGSSIITFTGNGMEITKNSTAFTWTSSPGSELRFTNTVTANRSFLGNGSVATGVTYDMGNTVLVITAAPSGADFSFDGVHPNFRLKIVPTGVPFNVSLGHGQQYTVQSWDVVGTAGALITIKSRVAGNQTSLVKASGIVQSNYISLKDNWASGGAAFIAGANSTLGTNVQGWTLVPVAASQPRAIIMA